jgi:hypothetical protein
MAASTGANAQTADRTADARSRVDNRSRPRPLDLAAARAHARRFISTRPAFRVTFINQARARHSRFLKTTAFVWS